MFFCASKGGGGGGGGGHSQQEEYPDKYLSYFSMNMYVLGTHQKCLIEALLMSTHNICFQGEEENCKYFYSGKAFYVEL